jgi:RNA polymerase sigma factor (sigma-70 family)
MITMHHHTRHYIAATGADRRASATKRRSSTGADELETVLVRAARGDEVSWTTLVERFTARVRAVAVRHRLSAHDVDDVLQNTWLRLFEHIGDVRKPAAVGAWLDTTARHESLRVIRRANREVPMDEALPYEAAQEPVDDGELVVAERRAALIASIGRLPPSQRRVISALLAHPSLSYSEIARALETPVGSIGPTRARSLTRLREDPELVRAIAGAA